MKDTVVPENNDPNAELDPETPETPAPEADPAPEPEADEVVLDPDDPEFDREKALEKIRKLNSEQKNQRDKTKAQEAEIERLRVFEQRVKEIEDGEKSDLEKALAQIEDLKADNKAKARSVVLKDLRAKHDLTDEQLEFLTGDTEEELIQNAEKLVAAFVSKETKTRKPGADDLSGGREPRTTTTKPTPREIGAKFRL